MSTRMICYNTIYIIIQQMNPPSNITTSYIIRAAITQITASQQKFIHILHAFGNNKVLGIILQVITSYKGQTK